ncbi:MAG: PorT family protein [Chlorobi bacterium]|nr:PorT family protein [Chlorobiota bacterium]
MKTVFSFHRLIRLFLILLILGTSTSLFSQDCVLKLREAQRLYEQGQVEKIPEILASCINKGFTREDKLTAYKLLIQAYQFDDNMAKAEEILLDFLGLFPEYQTTPADPPEFVQLLNTFEVIPRFSAGVHAGTGYTLIQVTGKYDAQGNSRDYGNYSSKGIPLNLGVFVNFFLARQWQLCLEADFSSFKFSYDDNTFLGIGRLSYEETQNKLSVPVTATYEFINNTKWTPFLRGGPGINILLLSQSQTSLQYTGLEHDPRTGESLNRTFNRNRLSGFAVLGGGIKYKLSKGYLIADLRFNPGFTNQTKIANRYASPDGNLTGNDINWYYLFTDDNFFIHNLDFTVGYVRKFYVARKK